MTDLPAPRRDKTRLALIIVLALSLLLNALAIGAALRLHHLRQALTGGDTAGLTLPAEMRKDLIAAITTAPGLKTDLARVQDARRAAIAAATAKPFDRTATEAALTALRGEVTTLMTDGQQVVLDDLARTAP